MSNISSVSPIAASVSQSVVQQKQIARAKDADRNRQQEAARKLREQAEQNARAVEDSAKASDQTVNVQGEGQHDEQHERKRRDPRQAGYPDTSDADHHVDVEA